jgi:hypothetical protein
MINRLSLEMSSASAVISFTSNRHSSYSDAMLERTVESPSRPTRHLHAVSTSSLQTEVIAVNHSAEQDRSATVTTRRHSSGCSWLVFGELYASSSGSTIRQDSFHGLPICSTANSAGHSYASFYDASLQYSKSPDEDSLSSIPTLLEELELLADQVKGLPIPIRSQFSILDLAYALSLPLQTGIPSPHTVSRFHLLIPLILHNIT